MVIIDVVSFMCKIYQKMQCYLWLCLSFQNIFKSVQILLEFYSQENFNNKKFNAIWQFFKMFNNFTTDTQLSYILLNSKFISKVNGIRFYNMSDMQ